jgi:hypothetical protein
LTVIEDNNIQAEVYHELNARPSERPAISKQSESPHSVSEMPERDDSGSFDERNESFERFVDHATKFRPAIRQKISSSKQPERDVPEVDTDYIKSLQSEIDTLKQVIHN